MSYCILLKKKSKVIALITSVLVSQTESYGIDNRCAGFSLMVFVIAEIYNM
jgi:hypothetical protein